MASIRGANGVPDQPSHSSLLQSLITASRKPAARSPSSTSRTPGPRAVGPAAHPDAVRHGGVQLSPGRLDPASASHLEQRRPGSAVDTGDSFGE